MRHLALALFFVTLAPPAMAQDPDQLVLVQALTSSSQTTRREAVTAARDIPPERRTPDLQLALDQEFIRYVQETRETAKPEGKPQNLNPKPRGRGGRGQRPETPNDPKAEDAARVAAAEADYLINLIDAVQPSSNTDLIPPLLKVIDTGAGATDALARFGDRAVPGLIALARSAPPESQFTSVLLTFRTMGEKNAPLSAGERAAVVSFLNEVLQTNEKGKDKARQGGKAAEGDQGKARAGEGDRGKPGSKPMMPPVSRIFDVATALEAGVALRDPGIRKIAEAIAGDSRVADKYLPSAMNIPGGATLLMQKARNALELYPK